MRRLGVVLLVLAGCSAPQPPSCQVTEAPLTSMGMVGRVVQASVGVVEQCINLPADPSKFHVADSATVEVLDPDGNARPFTSGRPTRSFNFNSLNQLVNVSFMPDRPGIWRVTAKLEPSIGASTQLIPVVDIQPSASVRVIDAAPFPIDCQRFVQSALGTVVCGTHAEIVTQFGQRFPASGAALEGTTLWLVKNAQDTQVVERWVEQVGGAFEKTHDARMRGLAASSQAVMAAAPDESLYFKGALSSTALNLRVVHVRPQPDGGLAARELGDFGGFSPSVLAAENDQVHACGVSQLLTINGVDGGQQQRILETLRRDPLGADETTMWTSDDKSLSAVQVTDAGLVQDKLALPRDAMKPVPSGPPLTPVLPMLSQHVNFGAVPELVDGKIVLKGYLTDAGFQMVGATKRHVFARSNDGTQLLQVIDR